MRRLDAEQRASMEEACQSYQEALGDEALSYLHGRGLDTEAIERFRLGYVADPAPDHKMYEGRLCIPVIKKTGVCGFKFRCIAPHRCDQIENHAKYLTRESQMMFNVTALDDPANTLEITEGEFDTMILSSILGLSAIALPGVKSWSAHPWWARMLRGHRTIRVWADNDEGKAKNYGHELAEQICKDLPQAYIIYMPPGMDVNDTYLEYGPDRLMELAGL